MHKAQTAIRFQLDLSSFLISIIQFQECYRQPPQGRNTRSFPRVGVNNEAATIPDNSTTQ